jgi:hypothetical protein
MSQKPTPNKFLHKLGLPHRPASGHYPAQEKVKPAEQSAPASAYVGSLGVQKIALGVLCNMDRHRLVAGVVDKLVTSFSTVGQIQPISVRRDETSPDKYAVLCGAHRVAAARKLNWLSIDALVFERDAEDLTLIEIAENLHRKQLSVLDKARLQAKWLTIVRQRDVQDAQPGGVQPHDKGYSKAARLLGSDSTREEIRRSEAMASIPDQVVPHIIKHELDNIQNALLEIAEVSDVEAQIEKVSELAERRRNPARPRRAKHRKALNAVASCKEPEGQARDLIEDQRKPKTESRREKGSKLTRGDNLNRLEAGVLLVKLERQWESLAFRRQFENAPLKVRQRFIDEVLLRST